MNYIDFLLFQNNNVITLIKHLIKDRKHENEKDQKGGNNYAAASYDGA